MPVIESLHVYPIKSCRGIALSAAQIEDRGLATDRRFMLIDSNNRFVTQRQHPKMAHIQTRFENDDALVVSAPEVEPISISLRPDYQCIENVRIWRSVVEVSIADETVNSWFSKVLGFAVRLAYMRDDQHRAVPNDSAAFDDEVAFADGAPILLIGTASLEDLNSRLEKPVLMRQFRPNIVVDTSAAFAEDGWRQIRIAGIELQLAWSCSRCTITTIDTETAVPDSQGEPLETLKAYRRQGRGVMFGQNVLPRGRGTIRVGDTVEVLA